MSVGPLVAASLLACAGNKPDTGGCDTGDCGATDPGAAMDPTPENMGDDDGVGGW